MHDAANRRSIFFTHDPDGVRASLACVNNERFAGLLCGAYVIPEAIPLPLQIAFQPIVIKTCFANGDDFRMCRETYEALNVRLFAFNVTEAYTFG
jgi:hypothetical protein